MEREQIEQKPHKFFEMLRYKRPAKHRVTQKFANRFLRPVMGAPDSHGNFTHIIYHEDGTHPDISFMAHYDTVHRFGGKQRLTLYKGILTSDADCLGADCTAGVWLILEMIWYNIPGVYVVHADEEIGCRGSSALVKDNPDWISKVNFAISFDRYGTESIITHQSGMRTASDEFAESLESILELGLEADPGGSYTDSNEYAEVISECTNVSVGYDHQHTKYETQDIHYLKKLRDKLIAADWAKLEYFRDETVVEDWWSYPRANTGYRTGSYPHQVMGKASQGTTNYDHGAWNLRSNYRKLIRENPLSTAAAMEQAGFTLEDLIVWMAQDGKEYAIVDALTDNGYTFDDMLQHYPYQIQVGYIF